MEVHAVVHDDMQMYDCYVQKLPKLEQEPPESAMVSEPVGYLEVVFHVPIMSRGTNRMEEVAKKAIRHYVKKVGQPDVGMVLKVSVFDHTSFPSRVVSWIMP